MIRLINRQFSRHPASWLTRTLLAGCLLAATLFTGAPPATAAPVAPAGRAPTPSMSGQAALDQLKARDDYPALVEAITAARYAIHPVADGSGLWAQNPANGFNATFTTQGVAVTAPGPALNPTEPDAAYRTRWQLTSLGYGAAQQPVAAGTLHYAGTRVELVRPSVTEWFVNGPSGLEHGFTLPARPAANPRATALRLTMQVDGALTPQMGSDGQQLTLHNAAGQVVLTYDHLKVWDATGAALPAHLMTNGRQVQVLVDDAQARYPLTIDPTFSQQAYLKANNSGASDNFGESVAISGDTVVVGARVEASNATTVNGDGSNNSASYAGAAYVFVRSGSSWSQQAYLKANNSEAGDVFGISVAVSGDTIVVGAYGEDSNASTVNGDGSNNSANNAGAAYVFVRSGSSWSQQAYLKANNSQADDYFGQSVAVAGDTVVVGTIYEASNATTVNGDGSNNSAIQAGAAYVFVRSGSSWSQQAYLKANNSGADDQFGISVAVSGDTVVVGARLEDSNATTVNGNGSNNLADSAGAAYVFVRSGSSWSQQAYLKANNHQAGDGFGYSVAVTGDTVVVGAIQEDSNATTVNGDGSNNSAIGAGAAYVFVRSGSSWSQQAYLKANNSEAGDFFGTSVAVSGDTVVVGARGEASNATTVNGDGSNNSASYAGAAYVFVRSGSSWSQQAYLKANNSESFDQFGGSVAVSVDTVIVGAHYEDGNATTVNGDGSNNSASQAGAAYVFTLPTTPEIDVTGNGVAIANGDSTPSTSDATDFGTAEANGYYATSSLFYIANVGDGQLDISDITLSGTGKDEFRIVFFSDPPASVPPHNALEDSFVFFVDFGPLTPGLHEATVSIANNDSDENPYTFAIQGTGTSAAPSLSIPSTSRDASNGTFNVPVNFTSDGASIASVGFALDYQESCLTFDATDGNSDGIPDAITGLPSGFVASISHDANDTGSELDISLFDSTAPMSTLSDGALLTVAFSVKPACITTDGTTTNVTLNFAGDPAPSFSDALANDVTGTSSGATIGLQFNATPTAINLDNNSVAENAASGATVGTLSTVDPDSGDTHTYALVSGSGDSDNASFVLDGATLKTAASFDFETKSSYSVRLRTTDNGGLNDAFEQALTINVTNVNEAPVAVADAIDPLTTIFIGGQATNITVLANDTDPENDPLSVGSVNTTGTQGSVTNNGTDVSYTAPNANGSSSFSYQASDGSLSSTDATVNVAYVKNDLRGDCNANGSLTAADFVATILEIFDTNDTQHNSNPAWWLIYTGDFAGSPRGCDSNAGKNGSNNSSDSVSAGDIVCTVLLFFKGNCGSSVVAAGQQTTAQLTVADASAQPGQSATVTVNFNPAGNQVAAASFALVIDPSQLGFDATDANGDGLPDAVQLTVPAGMSKSVQWNAAQNRLEVAVFGASLPLPTLGEGVLATVNLQVAATAAPGVTTLGVALASLGDTEGQDLAVAPTSGVLTIGDGAAARNLLYLPVAVR